MRGRGKLSGTPVYWTNFHSEVIFNFVLGVKDLSLIFAVHLQGVLLFAEGSVVQLVRMPPCHGGGRGFESRPVRNFSKLTQNQYSFLRVFSESG